MFVLIEFQCSVLPPLNLFLDFFAMDISEYIPDSASYQALSSYQTDKSLTPTSLSPGKTATIMLQLSPEELSVPRRFRGEQLHSNGR